MNHVTSIAKKELRAYFLSPIALIFLGTFVFVTLFTFLWVQTFFARNIADVRPLFVWLPRLLIFLCAALTMRLWSEEQKLGTLELLMTLPVDKHRLVLGKFLAALGLVGVALALTFHIPIAVSFMGDLDWGPVFGGYAAAMLVAASYIAIGLCISAITENQIIALIFTCLTCGVLYMLGSEVLTGATGQQGAEILAALGAGSRFESIERGVIDIRDLLYYASITTIFLVLNVLILKAKGWSEGSNTRTRRVNATLYAGLVAANLLALNIWMASAGRIRLDLTERNEYSVSDVTKNLVRSLPEPLLLRGYFSEKTHRKLAPLVPTIRDTMTEFGVVAGGNVKVEFVDPQTDVDKEKEANQAYGIKSFPFGDETRRERSVVNSYFSILVKYGDQFEVLNFSDLIQVQPAGQGDVDVKLKNFEYDLTRTIKKVTSGFQTLEALFAEMKGDAELKAYVTPDTLPEMFKELPARIENVGKELARESGGKLKFMVVNPDAPGATESRQFLWDKFRMKPLGTLFSQDTFYVHVLLRVGDKVLPAMPLTEPIAEADLKKEIIASVKRSAPGFLKTVGLFKIVEQPPQHPQIPGRPPPPPQDVTRTLQKKLQGNYQVRDVDLKDGRVPGDIDVLVLYGPKDLDEKQKFAVDQYLMRGGSLIVLAGKYELDMQAAGEGLAVKKNEGGVEDLLASYGVTIQDSMVLDPQNESLPIPEMRDLGGGVRIPTYRMLPYPYWIDVRQDGLNPDNPMVNGLPSLTLQWASPLVLSSAPAAEKEGEKPAREVIELVKTTEKAWTKADTDVSPKFDQPNAGFTPGSDQKAHVLAAAITGKFESYYKDKPNPMLSAEGKEGADLTVRTIKESPDNARLIVVGSHSFLSDVILQASAQSGTNKADNNLEFLQNTVDWSVEDVDLLAIRSRGTFARTLLPMSDETKRWYEVAFYGVPVLALLLCVLVVATSRRRMQPMELDSMSMKVAPSGGPSIGGSATEARS